MSYKRLLSSKLVIGLLVILLAFLGNVKYRQWKIKQAIEKEKQDLSQQAANLEKKNTELSQSLSYLNSGGFKERVAREQLGLKKDGEQVFDFSSAGAPPADQAGTAGAGGQSNFQQWLNYFFGNP